MRRNTDRIFDEYLVASARQGDRKAFSMLVSRWQTKLMAHAYRLSGDPEASRDIVQEAWVDIAKGISSLSDSATFPAWAFRIVTRRAADLIRTRQRQRRTGVALKAEPLHTGSETTDMEASADAQPLQKAIATLPPEQRAAIALYYQQEFSVAEIATALQVPAGTVKTRLMHARKKLRAVLEKGNPHD